MTWRTVWKAQRGGGRPCDASVTFRCGAVTYDVWELIYYYPVSFHLQPCQFAARFSLSPEIPKTCWRQFCVAHRVLDVAVAEISLQGSGVVPPSCSLFRGPPQSQRSLG
jgi:hypothetical protein